MVKILVADGQESVRGALRKFIAGEPGLEIVGEAADGQTAVDLAQKLGPDVVIIDVVMPGVDGINATRQIVEEQPGTKVLAFSVHADRPFVNAMFQAGASGYQVKGRSLTELTGAIRDLVNDQKYVSPEISRILIHSLLDRMAKSQGVDRDALSTMEFDILGLMADGNSNREIATRLGLGMDAIESHYCEIMEKLHIKSAADLVLSVPIKRKPES